MPAQGKQMKLLIENWKKFINEGEYHPETEEVFDKLFTAATNAKEALGIPYDPSEYLRFVETQTGGNSKDTMIARANHDLWSATQTDKSRLAYDDASMNEEEMQIVGVSPDQINTALATIPDRETLLDIFDTKDDQRGGFMHKLSNANKGMRWGLAERLLSAQALLNKAI
tara:strand:+ start:34 stop:543 length:510 start_codon:yes stop_codon:yes gene_type:complete